MEGEIKESRWDTHSAQVGPVASLGDTSGNTERATASRPWADGGGGISLGYVGGRSLRLARGDLDVTSRL